MEELLHCWPYNLAVAIFQNDEDALKVYTPGLLECIKELTDAEQKVIHYRYVKGETLAACGKHFDKGGICRERVRQINVKALRKLRHANRICRMQGISVSQIQNHLEMLQKRHLTAEHLVSFGEASLSKETEEQLTGASERMKIEELEWSVRTYHGLAWAGFRTLGDVAALTKEQLLSKRNLGKKSVAEIIEKLAEKGLTLAR